MTMRRLFLAVAAGAATLLAGTAGFAAAADFGGEPAYGMQVPYLQSDVSSESYARVRHRYRIRPPMPIYDAPVYDNGYGGNGQDPYLQPPPQVYGQLPYPDEQVDVYAQEPLPPRPGGQCLQSWQIQNMLARQGWRDFSNPQKGVDVVGLTARRPNRLTYRLKLDRCTGVIIQAYLLDQPDTRRSYGYNPDAPPPGY